MTRVEKIEKALGLLGEARNLLKAAKAPQATDYVRRAMKSVEGARRHALRMESDHRLQPLAPHIAPMDPVNPMHSLGYRWELIDERGHGIGGAVLWDEAEELLALHLTRKAVAS